MKDFPERLHLGNLPTRIEKLERFSKEVGLNVYIKRDDLTGLECSGNKIRKLEFAIKEALDMGAEVLITCGGIQSNHCRATAGAAARLGLKSCLVLRSDDPEPELDGNYFLDKVLGADVRIITSDEYRNSRAEIMEKLAEEYLSKGMKAYIIPEGASNGIGTFGYLSCVKEIEEQEKEMGVTFDTVVDAVGSGGTFAGLYMSNLIYGLNKRFVGVNVCDDAPHFQKRVCEICRETGKYLGIDVDFDPKNIEIVDGYVGEGYALSTIDELNFIRDFARLEGIILDPVYTGKCMYGFFNEVKKGRFADCKNVLFMHTGGLFGIFPKKNQFEL